MDLGRIILYILSFAIMLSIIVFIHELGHFLTAKKFGVYCGEFSIGMGPLVWKKQGKETQYSIRALPVGGFVSMAGEEDDTKKDADVPFERTINGIKWWQKIIVMLAGIFMNVVLAWVVFIGVTMAQGQVNVEPDNYTIAYVVENSVAQEAGFEADDIIKEITFDNGEKFVINNRNDLSRALGFNPGEKATYTIERDGQEKKIVAKTKYDEESETYNLGVSMKAKQVDVNAIESIGYGTKTMLENTTLIFESLGRIFRGKNLDQLSGPVGIFKITGTAVNNGILYWFKLLAILSVNVGIFNLLPLPILDGGRALITVIERIIGRSFNEKVLTAIMYVGAFALILLLAYATFNDIGRLF